MKFRNYDTKKVPTAFEFEACSCEYSRNPLLRLMRTLYHARMLEILIHKQAHVDVFHRDYWRMYLLLIG